MSRVSKKLPVVIREPCKTCNYGYHYRRLDNDKIVKEGRLEVLTEPPIILQFPSGQKPSAMINLKGKYPRSAKVLLLGKRFQEQDDDYYPASYCRIRR